MTTDPPRRRRLPAVERRQQLLDVAEELFKVRGFDDTSIEDIATGAGVTRPIVYRYFGSKEGVYLACIERARGDLARELAEVFEGDHPPETILYRSLDIWFSMVERDPARWKVLFSTALPLTGELGEQIRKSSIVNAPVYVGALRRWVPDHVPDEVIQATAVMLTGSSDQLARWWIEHPEIPRTVVVELAAEFTWAGLVPLARRASRPD